MPIAFEDMTLSVTVSIGVTSLCPEDIEATLHRADRALYLAKKGGRNRVELLLQEQEPQAVCEKLNHATSTSMCRPSTAAAASI